MSAHSREDREANIRRQFDEQLKDVITNQLDHECDDAMDRWEEARTQELEEAIPAQVDSEWVNAMEAWKERRAEEVEKELRDQFEKKLDAMIDQELAGEEV
jgi:hypothetical protein